MPSRYLDFGRGNHSAGRAFGERRQAYGRRSPPSVSEHPAQRGIACDVSDQLDRGGIKRRLDRDRLSFIGRDDRLKLYVPLKRIAAVLVQVADANGNDPADPSTPLFRKGANPLVPINKPNGQQMTLAEWTSTSGSATIERVANGTSVSFQLTVGGGGFWSLIADRSSYAEIQSWPYATTARTPPDPAVSSHHGGSRQARHDPAPLPTPPCRLTVGCCLR